MVFFFFLELNPYLCGEIQNVTVVKSLIKYALSLLLGWMFLAPIQAKASGGEGEYDAKEFAMHHVADAHEWHIVGGFTIPLPCIVIHDGLHVFMSNKMPEAHHGGEEPATAEHHETYQGSKVQRFT